MAAFFTKLPLHTSITEHHFPNLGIPKFYQSPSPNQNSFPQQPPRFSRQLKIKAVTKPIAMEPEKVEALVDNSGPMKLLFVEMGVGYDQHGQNITAAAMRACKDAISSNSIPAFRRDIQTYVVIPSPEVTTAELYHSRISIKGFICISCVCLESYLTSYNKVNLTRSIPGVSFGEMKLQIKLGVPHSLQSSLDIERVKSVFPYGEILNVEVVDGGLICSSGVYVEEMGDKNEDCYIVNAAVYVGY